MRRDLPWVFAREEDWNDGASQVRRLLQDPEELDRRQLMVMEYWEDFTIRLRNQIYRVLSKRLAEKKGVKVNATVGVVHVADNMTETVDVH